MGMTNHCLSNLGGMCPLQSLAVGLNFKCFVKVCVLEFGLQHGAIKKL
jgi:hypothetical protein